MSCFCTVNSGGKLGGSAIGSGTMSPNTSVRCATRHRHCASRSGPGSAPMRVTRRSREALQHQHVGLDERAVLRLELDQHVGVEVHRVVLHRVQLLDVREERVGRPLEEAVIVERAVVIRLARRLPVLPVDGAREALQAVLDRGARLELLEEGGENLSTRERLLPIRPVDVLARLAERALASVNFERSASTVSMPFGSSRTSL